MTNAGPRSLLVTPASLARGFAPADIGRVIAEELEMHVIDATARVRYGGGILVEEAPLERLESIGARLASLELETVIVDRALVRDLPPAIRWTAADPQEAALEGRTSSGRRFTIDWSRVRALTLDALPPARPVAKPSTSRDASAQDRSLTHSARVETLAARAGGQGGLSPRAQRLLDALEEAGQSEVDLYLTVYARAPAQIFRLERTSLDHSARGRGRLQHSLDNFLLLADDLASSAPEAWGCDRVRAFLKDLDPKHILLVKPEEAERRDRWIAYWHLRGAGESISRTAEEDEP